MPQADFGTLINDNFPRLILNIYAKQLDSLSGCETPMMFVEDSSCLSSTFSLTPQSLTAKIVDGGDLAVALSSYQDSMYMLFLTNRPDHEEKDKDVIILKYTYDPNGNPVFEKECVRVSDMIWKNRTEALSVYNELSSIGKDQFFNPRSSELSGLVENMYEHYNRCMTWFSKSPKTAHMAN